MDPAFKDLKAKVARGRAEEEVLSGLPSGEAMREFNEPQSNQTGRRHIIACRNMVSDRETCWSIISAIK